MTSPIYGICITPRAIVGGYNMQTVKDLEWWTVHQQALGPRKTCCGHNGPQLKYTQICKLPFQQAATGALKNSTGMHTVHNPCTMVARASVGPSCMLDNCTFMEDIQTEGCNLDMRSMPVAIM